MSQEINPLKLIPWKVSNLWYLAQSTTCLTTIPHRSSLPLVIANPCPRCMFVVLPQNRTYQLRSIHRCYELPNIQPVVLTHQWRNKEVRVLSGVQDGWMDVYDRSSTKLLEAFHAKVVKLLLFILFMQRMRIYTQINNNNILNLL